LQFFPGVEALWALAALPALRAQRDEPSPIDALRFAGLVGLDMMSVHPHEATTNVTIDARLCTQKSCFRIGIKKRCKEREEKETIHWGFEAAIALFDSINLDAVVFFVFVCLCSILSGVKLLSILFYERATSKAEECDNMSCTKTE
jgi:hypothetical protein